VQEEKLKKCRRRSKKVQEEKVKKLQEEKLKKCRRRR
jgi:hypothetical protein